MFLNIEVGLREVVTVDAGKPILKWTKGRNTATDIYVDRGDGKGFVFLATATVSHYTDQFAIPAGSNIAQWISDNNPFSIPASLDITNSSLIQ